MWSLVDTDADLSFISLNLANRVNAQLKKVDRNVRFAIGGTNTVYSTILDIEIIDGNQQLEHNFLVIKNLQKEVIIGHDLIKILDLTIHPREATNFHQMTAKPYTRN